ncbi:MAG TPA: 50S ribosomal protein L11 methyltransferase [Dehalococcoidia bacterium]|nr:50S ribosomal protein L11 methyltransferase [Dehalococcoidia bacterium]
MRYTELTVLVDPAQAELAADVLRTVVSAGVSIEAPFTQPDLESDAVPRGDGAAMLRTYLGESEDAAAAVRIAADAFIAAGIAASVSRREVDEQDWAEAWKEHFDVERFGRMVVVPSWRSYDRQDGDVVMTLDPGMAFGTGQHETTRMCLEALDARVHAGMRVLDAGCGSGILSIAAAKLRAREVLAVDVDPDCVRITRENAEQNGVSAVVRAVQIVADDHAWVRGQRFDVIVANIIAAVIIELAPVFAVALEMSGRLIASGIIAAREDAVRRALEGAGLRVESVRTMGEWRCIEAMRDGGAA